MVELADTPDLGSGAIKRAGSNPVKGITLLISTDSDLQDNESEKSQGDELLLQRDCRLQRYLQFS